MDKVTLKTFLHPRYWYAWPVLALMLVMSRMPNRVLWILGSGMGEFFTWFSSPSRRFAERNIALCFPGMNARERGKLVKRHFRLSGYTVLGLSVIWFAPIRRIKKFVSLKGQENFDAARVSGKNVIMLAPHFIALDIGGMRAGFDQGFVCMYRKARDPLLEYLFQRRTRTGAVLVDRLASLKSLIRYIREGRPFYYLPDQDMGERSSVFIPFFGIPTATVTALSRIAETTNSAVVPCISRILPHGKGFEVQLLPAFENFPSDDSIADARYMNSRIEEWVREMPDQYMWSYRRFKTRPKGEKSFYE